MRRLLWLGMCFFSTSSFSQTVPFPVTIKYIDLSDTLDERVDGIVRLGLSDYSDTVLYLLKGDLTQQYYGAIVPWYDNPSTDWDDSLSMHEGWYSFLISVWYQEKEEIYTVRQYLQIPDYDYVISYSVLPDGRMHGDLIYTDTLGTYFRVNYKKGKPDLRALKKYAPGKATEITNKNVVGLFGRNDGYVNPCLEIVEDGTYQYTATVGNAYRDTISGSWKIENSMLVLTADRQDIQNNLKDGNGQFYLFGKYLCRNRSGFVDPYTVKTGLKKMK